MAKSKTEKPAAETTPPETGPVTLTYIGPRGAESPRYGALEPGRDVQELDPVFATYLVETHPDHWKRA